MVHGSTSLSGFNNLVGIKYQLYNSLFTSLPFHRIEKTGILLSLLLSNCEEGYRRKKSPTAILEHFFSQHTTYTREEEQIDLLFRFVQYVERQVVLFDALEDASFSEVNDMTGPGTMRQLESEVRQLAYEEKLRDKLVDFSVRLVLTAHPTQFYPGSVLGIINDLSRAIRENNVEQINMYLQQLGKTPFFKKRKPTPFDEAVSLIWFLENVFYPACGRITSQLKRLFPDLDGSACPIIRMGFWPGGDRDGNPFVTAEVTRKVADGLRSAAMKCYYLDVRKLKRRLTFEGVEEVLQTLENKLYANLFIPGYAVDIKANEILLTLAGIRETLIYHHNGLFLSMVDGLIARVELFGLFFASLDIRQESGVHHAIMSLFAAKGLLPRDYDQMDVADQIAVIGKFDMDVRQLMDEPMVKETLDSIDAVRYVQRLNGEEGCHRYIISQCGSSLDVLQVLALFVAGGWKREEITVDIIPLFETIDDLNNAAEVMRLLYEDPVYKAHLNRRMKVQTIMLGFSDGTKDGGYLMANWGIFKAKEALTLISREFGIKVIFFDGRGGPPARGGGKTHKFYASLGKKIANNEIQLTIQGQTISSNFGTVDAAQFNIEQLIHAGISNDLFNDNLSLQVPQIKLMDQLAGYSQQAYVKLREHPGFMEYLSNVSPLRFYAETNIGSRPAKRGANRLLTLSDLRAIPYVGAWSQLKQNLTGYYGVGSAFRALEEAGKWNEVQQLYNHSTFFRTLMENCEMAMKKCFFPLTEYLADHPKYGEIWNMIHDEYVMTEKYLLKLSGSTELMSSYPIEQLSVQMRERIVLPLTTIQQYALAKVRAWDEELIQSPLKATYEKLAMRCSFGIINAGRNSA